MFVRAVRHKYIRRNRQPSLMVQVIAENCYEARRATSLRDAPTRPACETRPRPGPIGTTLGRFPLLHPSECSFLVRGALRRLDSRRKFIW